MAICYWCLGGCWHNNLKPSNFSSLPGHCW